MYLARFPATRACTVTSFVTIAPAAIIATSPTIMLGQRTRRRGQETGLQPSFYSADVGISGFLSIFAGNLKLIIIGVEMNFILQEIKKYF